MVQGWVGLGTAGEYQIGCGEDEFSVVARCVDGGRATGAAGAGIGGGWTELSVGLAVGDLDVFGGGDHKMKFGQTQR